MEKRDGEEVRVNLAPFIGSSQRCKESILCKLVSLEGPHAEIRTDYPYREVSLKVERIWLENES